MLKSNRVLMFSLLVGMTFSGACKTVSSASSVRANDDANATVTLPVLAGPGKIKVTPEEEEFIKSVSARGNAFRNPAFWTFFAAHQDLANELLKTKWFKSLPAEQDAILKAAAAIGPHFILFLDMGIAIRANEFRTFALAEISKKPNITSFELRQAFSDSLPKAVVWRGVLLTPSEAEIVKKEGIKASGFYQPQNRQNTFLASEYLLRPTFSTVPSSVYDDLNRRLNGMTGDSIFASYSEWIEVTYAGCWFPKLQGGGLLRSGKNIKFHLFKVQVSELDLIRPNGMLERLVSDKKNQIYKTKGINGQPWSKTFADPAFEMFIQYVDPSEILDVVVYDKMPPQWET